MMRFVGLCYTEKQEMYTQFLL